MVNLVMKLLINGFAVWVTALLIPGVRVESWLTAVVVALVLGVVNTFVRPILVILTLPVTILTLGIFLLILNALMVGLVGWLVPGFTVAGLGPAILFSIVLWMVNSVLEMMTRDKKEVSNQPSAISNR